MSKVHITLVGGQAMPVYQGIEYSAPDKVIAICSRESKKSAYLIKNLIGVKDFKIKEFDATDLQKIETATKECFEEFISDDVSINISGGTKPWAYYFTRVFSEHPNTRLIYLDQNSTVWNLDTKESIVLSVDMDTQLLLQGARLRSYSRLEEYSNDDIAVIKTIDEIRSGDEIIRTELLRLVSEFNLHPNNTIARTRKASLIWDKKSHTFDYTVNLYGKPAVRYKMCSPHAYTLVTGGAWFEVAIAKTLSNWAKCKELRMNCIFDITNKTENEVDMMVNIGHKLLFVECKTQIHAITDIDKFNSVVKKFGGNGSKAMFVTFDTMTDDAKEICRKYGIIPFSYADYNSPEANLYKILNDKIDKNNL